MKIKGFTLIELVIVIVVLGVLSAVAVPKFVNLSAEARTSTLEGVKAAMQSAAAKVYSKSLVKGNHKEVDDTITLADGNFLITFGYPFAEENDWKRIISLDNNFKYLSVGSTSSKTLIIYRSDSPTPTSFSSPCMLYYRAPANVGAKPEYTLNDCE